MTRLWQSRSKCAPGALLLAFIATACDRPADKATLRDDLTETAAATATPAAIALASGQVTGPVQSADNPFSNTCDGNSVGFRGADGQPTRMAFPDVPQGAVLQCRSGPEGKLGDTPFRPCDGANGTKAFHFPGFTVEGMHRTEMRYVAGNRPSPVRVMRYYVHRSLDGVKCCQSSHPDSAWFAAARQTLKTPTAFDTSTRIEKPFITVTAVSSAGRQSEELLSLRRAFRMSDDRRLMLIRRSTCSRRAFEKDQRESCLGLTISVPKLARVGNGRFSCHSTSISPYDGGQVPAQCPGIYCTVTACRIKANFCTQVTHTFNRGPGQAPWIKSEPEHCPPKSILSFTDYACEAYVLNAEGHGVCLVSENGRIRPLTVVAEGALGVAILGSQRHALRGRDRYVFSAKSPRETPGQGVLYLPQ